LIARRSSLAESALRMASSKPMCPPSSSSYKRPVEGAHAQFARASP
jgi:transposase-like protein